jgi:hypothetical protein
MSDSSRPTLPPAAVVSSESEAGSVSDPAADSKPETLPRRRRRGNAIIDRSGVAPAAQAVTRGLGPTPQVQHQLDQWHSAVARMFDPFAREPSWKLALADIASAAVAANRCHGHLKLDALGGLQSAAATVERSVVSKLDALGSAKSAATIVERSVVSKRDALGGVQSAAALACATSSWLTSGIAEQIRLLGNLELGGMGSVTSLHEATAAAADLEKFALRAVQVAEALSQRAYVDVMAAQSAAINGGMEAVEQFFLRWMELPRRKWRERLEAGAEVLIATRLEEFGPDTAFELLDQLERETNHHFRRGRTLLGDTELNHLRVVSIDQLPARAGIPFACPEDFLPASPSVEERVLFRLNEVKDDRLEAVLGGLTRVERAVVLVREFKCDSWERAAVACGLPPSEGERVRAKLMRRVRRVETVARAAAPNGFSGR